MEDKKLEMKVFLGGTCNNSTWRDKLIKILKMPYFNPVVKNWTPADMERENREKEIDYFQLYVITPKMTGVYSIAESTESACINGGRTLICILDKDEDNAFDDFQMKSLNAVKNLANNHGAKIFNSLEEIAEYLNKVYVSFERYK